MRTRGQPAGIGSATVPITYRYGKPVMTSTVTINIIFYGSWAANAMDLTKAFVSGLGGSAWYGVNKRYYSAASASSTKTYVSNVVLGGTVVDAYSQGISLTGNAVPNIVQNQLNRNTFAVDTNAIYVVAISKDVSESYGGGSTFCGAYCGYHWYMNLPCSGRRIKYSLVGNTDKCPSGCNAQTKTPNGIPGVDGMLSVLAHEIVEAVSDPEANAWYDSNGDENADKCAWNFGPTQTDSTGAKYNMNIGGRNYLIQQNWDPSLQLCALSTGVPATSTTTATAAPSPTPSQCLSPPKAYMPSNNISHIMRTRGQPSSPGAATVPIAYHYGAPVMTSTVTINLIFYGNWASNEMDLTKAFVGGLGNSAWYGVNQRYYYAASSSSSRTYVTNLMLGGSVVDAYSQGASLSGNAVPNIVQNQLNLGSFSVDTNAIYIVAVSKDVTEKFGGSDSLCGTYCGYHSYADLSCSGRRIKYSLVGNTDQCPSGCNAQTTTPNGIPGVDGMLSILANEIVEAVSDPELNASYDASGNENADKCSWDFGSTQTDSNGAQYNINFNGRNYLIQQNWDPNSQACALL